MSKRRGLSVDEKRTRMLELFYEKKDFFQLKELERIAQKEKGITSMSVKEILQSLVDDGMVDSERIGTSNYFWAFPSKAMNLRKRKIEGLKTQIAELKKRKAQNEKLISSASKGRQETDDREKTLKNLAKKSERVKELEKEIAQYKECDPEVLENLRKETAVSKEAANRWTDNVFCIKSWCVKKFCMEERVIDKQFGIPEDFDYID